MFQISEQFLSEIYSAFNVTAIHSGVDVRQVVLVLSIAIQVFMIGIIISNLLIWYCVIFTVRTLYRNRKEKEIDQYFKSIDASLTFMDNFLNAENESVFNTKSDWNVIKHEIECMRSSTLRALSKKCGYIEGFGRKPPIFGRDLTIPNNLDVVNTTSVIEKSKFKKPNEDENLNVPYVGTLNGVKFDDAMKDVDQSTIEAIFATVKAKKNLQSTVSNDAKDDLPPKKNLFYKAAEVIIFTIVSLFFIGGLMLF